MRIFSQLLLLFAGRPVGSCGPFLSTVVCHVQSVPSHVSPLTLEPLPAYLGIYWQQYDVKRKTFLCHFGMNRTAAMVFRVEGLTSDAILEKQSKPKLNCRIHFILKNKKNVAFWWNLCQYGVGATWELQVACVAAFTASCFKGLLMLTWSEIRRRSHLDLSFPPHQIYWLPTITPGYPSSGESGVNWQ